MGLLACWVFGANLGGWRTLGTHEALAAVPARAMADGGDPILPDFGGVPRVKKPPLGYWLIAGAGSVGGGVTAFTARLPSAVSAALLCGVVGWWGGRWYGRRAGVGAALVQATSLWALTYGRKAEVDMTLALLTTAGLAVILTAPPGESAGRTKLRWIAAWIFAGSGWLGKFHFVPVLLFGPLVSFTSSSPGGGGICGGRRAPSGSPRSSRWRSRGRCWRRSACRRRRTPGRCRSAAGPSAGWGSGRSGSTRGNC